MIPKPTVLVVDDDQDVLNATVMTLRYAGFTVLTAISPEEVFGIWRTRGEMIDALIADVDLRSAITGEQLCDLLQLEEPRLLTILLTAHSMGASFFGRIEGPNFFQKPYDVNALISAVKDLFVPSENRLPSSSLPEAVAA